MQSLLVKQFVYFFF